MKKITKDYIIGFLEAEGWIGIQKIRDKKD